MHTFFLQFLKECLEWLNEWELKEKKGLITSDEFLTRETSEGLRVTITSTIQICEYLINNFGFEYILTGKINQDNLEVRFRKFLI